MNWEALGAIAEARRQGMYTEELRSFTRELQRSGPRPDSGATTPGRSP
jgi:hypothetical protein